MTLVFYLLARAAFREQGFDDAARSLGASIGGTLRRIHLPLMRGGILIALILVFVETMKEMPATLLLRPFGLDTLAVPSGSGHRSRCGRKRPRPRSPSSPLAWCRYSSLSASRPGATEPPRRRKSAPSAEVLCCLP
jgi:hypothetical protein